MLRRALLLLCGLGMLGCLGCDVAIRNGVFSCGQPTDCPQGYFCWGSDSRCYDAEEPKCQPRSCDEVIAEFEGIGIPIECGSLPDGCDGSIECGGCEGIETCGANGQNFICGCEENDCSTYGSGAECGLIPTRCGLEPDTIDCGSCLDDDMQCVDNECVCPPGIDCDDDCLEPCTGDEICVNGQCCAPTYPCTQNACSPDGGLPDGCGGVAHCPACPTGGRCVLSSEGRFECIQDCTCEAAGVECGSASPCGSPVLCGTCAENGFESGYRCDDGRCVCEDAFEGNDGPDLAAVVCGKGAALDCMQDAWSIDVEATLHGAEDRDYYALQVLDASTPVVVSTHGGQSDRVVSMAYVCPDGSAGLAACSGWIEKEQGLQFCAGVGKEVAIERSCGKAPVAEAATLIVGVRADAFRGTCDQYGFRAVATHTPIIPLH